MNTEAAQQCPVCNEGVLMRKERIETIRGREDAEVFVRFAYSECPVCGSEVTTPEQAKENQVCVLDARRERDRLLSGMEIRAVRVALGLTQAEAASLFGGGRNSFSKYERSEVLPSKAMDRLIRIAREFPQILPRLAEIETGVRPRLRVHRRYPAEIGYLVDEGGVALSCLPSANLEFLRQVKAEDKQAHEWVDDPRVERMAANG